MDELTNLIEKYGRYVLWGNVCLIVAGLVIAIAAIAAFVWGCKESQNSSYTPYVRRANLVVAAGGFLVALVGIWVFVCGYWRDVEQGKLDALRLEEIGKLKEKTKLVAPERIEVRNTSRATIIEPGKMTLSAKTPGTPLTEEVKVLVRKANEAKAKDDLAVVLALGQEIAKKQPEVGHGPAIIGEALAVQKQYSEAERYLRDALAKGSLGDKNVAEVHYLLAVCAHYQGRNDETVMSLKNCLRFDPGHKEALRLREALNTE